MRKLLLVLCLMALVLPIASAQESGAEVLWDSWGVPHIYADNNEDLYYGFGWAQMNNHADLILSLYARVRGEQAAYWGADFVESDVIQHTVGVPEIGQAQYEAQNPEFKAMVDAFVAGMNDWAEANPDAISERMQAVLPVRNSDPITLAYSNTVITFVGGAAFGFVDAWTGEQPGSNAWAIAPEKTESGNTMMILNPHLWWSDVFVWFEAQLVGPETNFYGATLVGLPALEIGFNDNLGWTHTVNTYDGFDVYELTLTPEGGYMLDGEAVPLEVEMGSIMVMQEDGTQAAFPFPVARSAHGPIIAQNAETGKALAFRIVEGTTHTMEQWWRMMNASNLDEFEDAMSWLQISMFNTIYGDRDGNIYYLFNGIIPERDQGDFNSWQPIQPGDDSSLIWDTYHTYDDLPKVVNPDTNFVQNANEPPWTSTIPPALNIEDFPAYFAPQSYYAGGHIFRPQVSAQTVAEDESISFDELVEYKHNTHVESTDHVLDDLIAAAGASDNELAQAAAEVLGNWDRRADADSQGAVLYMFWFQQYAGATGGDMFATPHDINDPFNTPSGLKDPEGAVATLIGVAEEVQGGYGALDVPYGDVMRIRVGEYDLPGNGGGDPTGVFRAAWYAPAGDGTFQLIGGDSWFVVLEFSDPINARVLVGQGNATQPGSAHVGDQTVLFANKEMRTPWLTREDVEANLEMSEMVGG